MLAIETVVVTDFAQNARIVFDTGTRLAAIIDPGGDIARILAACDEHKLTVTQVFLTHAHLDHAGGVAALRRALVDRGAGKPEVFGHPIEAEMRSSIALQSSMYGFPPGTFEDVPGQVTDIEDRQSVSIAGASAEVLFTPGHSPGHVAFYFAAQPAVLFADGRELGQSNTPLLIGGDALFAGSIGRTDLPGGDHQTLIDSITSRLLPLPDDTRVLAGHGPDTSIGAERTSNPFIGAGAVGGLR